MFGKKIKLRENQLWVFFQNQSTLRIYSFKIPRQCPREKVLVLIALNQGKKFIDLFNAKKFIYIFGVTFV